MTQSTEEAMIWPSTGEPMVHGEFATKLSFGGQSITVPLSGWWAKEANDGIVDPEALDIADRVLAILKARARGLKITAVAANTSGSRAPGASHACTRPPVSVTVAESRLPTL